VVTLDRERRILRDGTIVVDDGRIVDVGKSDELRRKYAAEETVDASNKIVLPGFVDSHTHVSAEQLVRGIVPDDIPGKQWFDWTSRIYSEVKEEDEYYSSLISFIECVQTGTTTVCDGGTVHSLAQVARAMQSIGIRGVIGKWCWDIPKEPKRMSQTTNEALESLRASVSLNSTLPPKVKVWPMLIGGYPLRCTDELICGAKGIADRSGLGLSMHQNTVQREVEASLEKTGKKPICHFEDLGILDQNLRLVHMIHTSDEEIELLAKREVKIVHCNTTALRMGYGATKVGKIPEMIQKGVCVSLGCDGTNSSNHVDMTRAIYLAAGLYKDARMDTSMIPAEMALEMATINGAKSILQQNEIGSIEKGKRADIIMFDRRRVEWFPLFNVVNTLVYTANGNSVDTVYVEGEPVMERGILKNVNELEVFEKVQELGQDLLQRAGLPLTSKWSVY